MLNGVDIRDLRLHTYRAGLILLLDDGRINERGTHDELVARRGIYHGMVVRQATSGAKEADPLTLRE